MKKLKINVVLYVSMWLILSSYGVTTLTSYYCFHTDRRKNIKNENVVTDDENALTHLTHLKCNCCTKK